MKKLMASVLVGIMAIGMAVPSFAASPSVSAGGSRSDTRALGTSTANMRLDRITVDIEVYDKYDDLIATRWNDDTDSVRVQCIYRGSGIGDVKVIAGGEHNGRPVSEERMWMYY